MLVSLSVSFFLLLVECTVDVVYFLVLYGFSIAYLVAPGTFDSAHVIEFVASMPDYVKYTGKVILAAPFSFHSLNGLRHLAWDMNKCESVCSLKDTLILTPFDCSHDSKGLLQLWLRSVGSCFSCHCRLGGHVKI